MHEERGQLSGNLKIGEAYTLWGSIAGNVTVIDGGKFYVRGAIYGNLIVEDGGRVHIFGNIQGDLTVKRGAKVIHSGVLGGDAKNQGGRLYVERDSRIQGKIKTRDGETKFEGPTPPNVA
jgi:cytoskeletal protein CcmA (bactofilin family)